MNKQSIDFQKEYRNEVKNRWDKTKEYKEYKEFLAEMKAKKKAQK